MRRPHLSQQSLTNCKLAAAALASVVGISPAISRAASTTRPSSLVSTTRPAKLASTVVPASNPQDLHPSVHWFAAWNEAAVAQSPGNAFSGVTTYAGAPQAADKNPLAVKGDKASPTTHPAPSYHVSVAGAAASYVFADFEVNRDSHRSEPQASASAIHNLATSKNTSFSEFQASQPPTAQGDDATHRSALFLTKAQYDILHVSEARAALYPGSNSIRSNSADVVDHGNLQARVSMEPGARSNAPTRANEGNESSPIGNEKLYHQRMPWGSQLSGLTTISLNPNKGAGGSLRFASVAGFPQLDPHTPHALSISKLNAQIAYYRLRGAYAANAFETGIAGYSVADQLADGHDNSYDASAAAPADADQGFAVEDKKSVHNRVSLSFNPTIDTNDESESKRSDNVYATIWSGAYALRVGHVEVLDRRPNSASSVAKYRTVDVSDVFTNKSPGAEVTVYASDEDTPATARSEMADASMHRLLEFSATSTRDYKGASVAISDFAAKPIWILNDKYTLLASHDQAYMGLPEPTLFGTFAAAGSMAVICRRRRRRSGLWI